MNLNVDTSSDGGLMEDWLNCQIILLVKYRQNTNQVVDTSMYMFWVLFRPSEAEEVELGHLEAIKKGFRTRSFYILFLTVLFVPTGMNWVGMFYKVCIALIKMWIKNFEEWLPVIVLWNVRFLQQMMWKKRKFAYF